MLPSDFTTIQLTQGKETIISNDDSDLAILNWYAHRREKRYYATRKSKIDGHWIMTDLHRIILERMIGRPLNDGEVCDHVSRNTLDNRRDNLRVANHSENATNRTLRSDNTTGYKGVYWNKKERKWFSKIQKNGFRKWLGQFNTAEEANKAYIEASKELHGEFASDR